MEWNCVFLTSCVVCQCHIELKSNKIKQNYRQPEMNVLQLFILIFSFPWPKGWAVLRVCNIAILNFWHSVSYLCSLWVLDLFFSSYGLHRPWIFLEKVYFLCAILTAFCGQVFKSKRLNPNSHETCNEITLFEGMYLHRDLTHK